MRSLFFIFFFFFARASFSQALPDDKVRNVLGQSVYEHLKQTNPNATPQQIDKTISKISAQYRFAQNDPLYNASSTRWVWIAYRLMARANPWVSVAIELCNMQGACAPNPKFDIQSQPHNDFIRPSYYTNDFRFFYSSDHIYFAGRMIPKNVFTCSGSIEFILNAEFYWPGLGDPCSVQANLPGAIDAHMQYLDKNIEYFGYSSSDFDYSYYIANSLIPSTPSANNILCTIIEGPYIAPDPSEPYWPCRTKPLTNSAINALSEGLAEGQPYTWTAYALSPSGSIRVVTDFPMDDLQLYPAAPPKGSIPINDWLQALTASDLASAVSPAWLAQLSNLAWLSASQLPDYDGLPFSPVTSNDVQSALSALSLDQVLISDLTSPLSLPVSDIFYATSPNPKPVTNYVFNWRCGFANYPACIIDFLFSGDPSLDPLTVTQSPFDALDFGTFTPPNNFLQFLNQRFTGSTCTTHRASASVSGRSMVIDWDFCKFATFARDVLALLAYIGTAGFLIGSLFVFRGK